MPDEVSAENWLREMTQFVERQRERIELLGADFPPIRVHASWLAVVDFKDAELRRAEGETRLALALLQAAEDECDRYKTALQEIAREDDWLCSLGEAQTVARSALNEAVKSS